jgi:FKBP-type peptidyl-prolyl cis-trans isomerase (trigger factor)
MKIGETKDIKLTFPEDYQSTELAGKEVVFTVKVNSIKVETPATLDDAWVEKYTNGKQKTVADFKESTRKEIEESKTMQVEFQAQNDAMKTIMDSSEFEPNNEAIEYEKNNQKNQLKKAAEENGMAFDALLSMYGMTEEQLDEQLDTYAKEAVNRRILIDTIAKEAKIKAKKEHYEYLAKQEGLEVKDLESRYGKEVVDEAAKRYAVIKFVVDKANKTERNYNQLDTGSNAGETQGEETQAK